MKNRLVSYVVLASFGACPLAADACSSMQEDESIPARSVALHELGLEREIFVVKPSGKLIGLQLDDGSVRELLSQEFYTSTTSASPDGRFISLMGTRLDGGTEYWLVDVVDGDATRYLEHARWGGGIPEFSPDGRLLAFHASYDPRWPNGDAAGLYVIETRSLQVRREPTPGTFTALDDRPYGSATWAQDGQLLLLMVRPMMRAGVREHFAFRVDDGLMEMISGEYDRQRHTDRFFLPDGTEIPTHPSRRPPTTESPGGSHRVSVDDQHRLVVEGGAEPVVVDRGVYDNCVGVTIRFGGWLDEHHLVYSINEGGVFVFDLVSGRRAQLPVEEHSPIYWTVRRQPNCAFQRKPLRGSAQLGC